MRRGKNTRLKCNKKKSLFVLCENTADELRRRRKLIKMQYGSWFLLWTLCVHSATRSEFRSGLWQSWRGLRIRCELLGLLDDQDSDVEHDELWMRGGMTCSAWEWRSRGGRFPSRPHWLLFPVKQLHLMRVCSAQYEVIGSKCAEFREHWNLLNYDYL